MLILIIIMTLTAILEGTRLYRGGNWRELFYFSLLWMLSFVYAALIVNRVPVPNPVDLIINLLHPLSQLLQ